MCQRRGAVLLCGVVVVVLLLATTAVAVTESQDVLPGEVPEGSQLVLAQGRHYRAQSTLHVKGTLVVEAGVTVSFDVGTGVVVSSRGVLLAQGHPEKRIVFEGPGSSSPDPTNFSVRLVDGPSVTVGRVELKVDDKWRSVCSNSRNWTAADLTVVCRQLGFDGGGSWWNWIERSVKKQARLLLEKPECEGGEKSLQDCPGWGQRQMGGGTCDYHPDMGISCNPILDPSVASSHWAGLKFYHSRSERVLTQENTLYVSRSMSHLVNVDIRYAGAGPDRKAVAALTIRGTAPQMKHVSILYSAYNGVNMTEASDVACLVNSSIKYNRGYGIYANSTGGQLVLEGCTVAENGADGIRFIHHNIHEDFLNHVEQLDFCSSPITDGQTYPVLLKMEQGQYSSSSQDCYKTYLTRRGYVLTVQFVVMSASKNQTAYIEVYDGSTKGHTLLATVPVQNRTLPQSIVSTGNSLFIRYKALAKEQSRAFVRITSGISQRPDLNITSSTIADNGGRGIAAEDVRSVVYLADSSVSANGHTAGLHVLGGSSTVNVTRSRIAFNKGDGVNVSYCGGALNVTHSSLSSNEGYGIALWVNDSIHSPHVAFKQNAVVSYSEIFRNLEVGVLMGNSCRDSYVNITGNWFNDSNTASLEVRSCRRRNGGGLLNLQVGHNKFTQNHLGFRYNTVVNVKGHIEYNHFSKHQYGALLVRNPLEEDLLLLPAELLIDNNYFENNEGMFVANLGLYPYSTVQHIVFTWNFVKDNRIKEPFSAEIDVSPLVPRSRVAAPIVVGSSNVDIFRNIIQNPESAYEIGSQLEDQSKTINCTYNWLGFSNEEKIYYRLFHRKDRYNLAKIEYLPYLLHSSNPGSTLYISSPQFVATFQRPGTTSVGGEVDGYEVLRSGEYNVDADISVRPGGKLELSPGVTLRFPPSVGLMVGGRFEARGTGPNSIRLTLKEEQIDVSNDNETVEVESKVPVRLLGGKTFREGRLQVRLGGVWGTVCNYGWTQRNSALVCHQLGLVLDPDDWLMTPSEIPLAGTSEEILLSYVRCTEEDLDITECQAEQRADLYRSCSHDNDVGLRCLQPAWAGVRLGPTAQRSDMQFVTVEHAGLLDYHSNTFKPGLQVDLWRHALESVRVVDNIQDGLGVVYSDLYSIGSANTILNSEFKGNRGSGISIKQIGLKITGCVLEDNLVAGLRHDPIITSQNQRELAGWLKPIQTPQPDYKPVTIPGSFKNIDLSPDESKFLVTDRVPHPEVNISFFIKCPPGFVIGIQLLNPIHNFSTEQIIIYDGPMRSVSFTAWDLRRDSLAFPIMSSSYGLELSYQSGDNAMGGTVLLLSAVRNPLVFRGPPPTLTVLKSRIRHNNKGIWFSYYNRLLTDFGDHLLRKGNESIQFFDCDISFNHNDALLVDSPHWDLITTNISEITIMINSSLITDNGRGIRQFSRDLRGSNNLFHWLLKDNSIERNKRGGFSVSLPYVWQYNENFTHSVVLLNNTWRNNNNFSVVVGGHFARLNVTRNIFQENVCRRGLLSIRGMEKLLLINNNLIENNHGSFMVEFIADSQSEILGFVKARFINNEIKRNYGNNQMAYNKAHSFVLGFHGLQKVIVNRNLFGENALDFELVAGIHTAQIENKLDVRENWWGTTNASDIRKKIFDFDDWNNHAVADFLPYLVEDSFDASLSSAQDDPYIMDLNNIGGRLKRDLHLPYRSEPYIIRSDVTVMPDVKMSIAPRVVLEFAPNVGLLVLGSLVAVGNREEEIIMRPLISSEHMEITPYRKKVTSDSVRLCTTLTNCTGYSEKMKSVDTAEGFLEWYNHTTMQWIPICDPWFCEKNAEVVCRELGLEPLNVFVSKGPRFDFHSGSLSRIWPEAWPEPFQCRGDEAKYNDCPVRLNGHRPGLYGQHCDWNSDFVFVHCGRRNLDHKMQYWGGIRFANAEFERNVFEQRTHNPVTHQTVQRVESVLSWVNITGAGVLHGEASPAVMSVGRSPKLTHVSVRQSASHGVSLVAPPDTVQLLDATVEDVLGIGVVGLSLTGENRDSEESSFVPLKEIPLPYHMFGIVDMCDPTKEITVEERVVLYFKYDNNPVNCVKIFNSVYYSKPFGFRLLQFNLQNGTGHADTLWLYDGDIYNISTKAIAQLEANSPKQRQLFRTKSHSLSVRLVAGGGGGSFGFFAEIVSLPVSVIGFNREAQHNVSYSSISKCRLGSLHYSSIGEVNPILTVEKNRMVENCEQFYGNFSSCKSAVYMDVQNTQTIYFRSNALQRNVGGLSVRADSRGSATALRGWFTHNLFAENVNRPALYVEGRQSSPYQEVIVYHNFFTRNVIPYKDVIVLKQVVSNFTHNFVQKNQGEHILEVSGFEKVRLPIYQTTSHNSFYWNYATERDSRATVVAGTAGQHYIDNIFYNPDNNYEIITVNRSLAGIDRFDVWKSQIDAQHNWWGYNETIAVSGRIRDQEDDPSLLNVNFEPFHKSNASLLEGEKCPPGWGLVSGTCYMYIGAPLPFEEARSFCRSVNASMPYIMGDYRALYQFLQREDRFFQYYTRVWVQNLDLIGKCTAFAFQTVTSAEHCNEPYSFLCEIDPKVHIDIGSGLRDTLAVAVISVACVTLLLITLAGACWWAKSRHRRAERLERRNSIRQSLRSLRSVGLGASQSGSMYTDFAHRHKIVPAQQIGSDYHKMHNGGSIDSMDKSQFNSSVEDDTRSYDIYEASNPSTFSFLGPASEAVNPTFDLTYRNEGFREPSASYYASSTLPLDSSLAYTDSTLEFKQPLETDMDGHQLLETDLDEVMPPVVGRSKSEGVLLDADVPEVQIQIARSHSQPLETAM